MLPRRTEKGVGDVESLQTRQQMERFLVFPRHPERLQKNQTISTNLPALPMVPSCTEPIYLFSDPTRSHWTRSHEIMACFFFPLLSLFLIGAALVPDARARLPWLLRWLSRRYGLSSFTLAVASYHSASLHVALLAHQ